MRESGDCVQIAVRKVKERRDAQTEWNLANNDRERTAVAVVQACGCLIAASARTAALDKPPLLLLASVLQR